MGASEARHVPTREQDRRLELAISVVLRGGVIAAALLVIVGGVLALRHPGALVPDYSHFQPSQQGRALTSLPGVFRGLTDPSGTGIIELGLLVLIATPIARVLFAAVGFARERDFLYVAISLIVLGILAFSLLHGCNAGYAIGWPHCTQ